MAESASRRVGRMAAPVLLLLFTSFVQFHQLARDLRFLPDEAFFMTFARGAAVNGDWLLPGALDKPPLSIYLSALSMVAFGVRADAEGVLHLDPTIGEFAGRLPNAFLAILFAALMMRLALRVYACRWAALLTGLLAATSPYLLAYGASAFTDMSALFWSVVALSLALKSRWAVAGAALGIAFWSKQQAAFFFPLIVMILSAGGGRRRDWLRFWLTLAGFGAALLLWDGVRTEVSIFLQAAANNAPESWLAAPSQWLNRLGEWLGRGLWLLGPPAVTGLLLAGAAFASTGAIRSRIRRVERGMLLYVVGFLLAHVVLQFNLYDRYLLLALPPLILLVAGRLGRLTRAGARANGLGLSDSKLVGRNRNMQMRDSKRRPYRASCYVLIAARCYSFSKLNWRSLGLAALLLAGGLWSVYAGTLDDDARGASAGIDALADHLNKKPVATVIYDPWLGWELGYYLGQWNDKRRAHYPTAEALAAGALALDEIGARYFVAPVDKRHADWLAALRGAGFGVALDYERDRFVVYRLSVPRA